jgi:hypothetical protein
MFSIQFKIHGLVEWLQRHSTGLANVRLSSSPVPTPHTKNYPHLKFISLTLFRI